MSTVGRTSTPVGILVVEPTPTASISLAKTAALDDRDVDGKADLGDRITYSFEVTNTGEAELVNLRVEDPMLAGAGIAVTCQQISLPPGETVTCTADAAYAVTVADIAAGKVSNTATAVADPSIDVDQVRAEDTVEVTTDQAAQSGVLAAGTGTGRLATTGAPRRSPCRSLPR